MELPDDLAGGWMFTEPFKPVALRHGQIWRKCGPGDALRIKRIMMPGQADYDGGLQGISVIPSRIKRNKVVWAEDSFFIPGNQSAIHSHLEVHGYAPIEAK